MKSSPAPITESEVRTLKQIAQAVPNDTLPERDVERLRSLGYVRDTADGPRLTQDGMMWVVGGTDD